MAPTYNLPELEGRRSVPSDGGRKLFASADSSQLTSQAAATLIEPTDSNKDIRVIDWPPRKGLYRGKGVLQKHTAFNHKLSFWRIPLTN
jgi:hypothetical protein